jgi:hypothetical protein
MGRGVVKDNEVTTYAHRQSDFKQEIQADNARSHNPFK